MACNLPVLQYKVAFDEEWAKLPQRGRAVTVSAIPHLYDTPLKIGSQEYEHLQQLKRVIPSDFHGFYDHLPHMLTMPQICELGSSDATKLLHVECFVDGLVQLHGHYIYHTCW